MSYTLQFTADFGALTGLALNAKLYDAAGAQVGSTITTGFVEIGSGVYIYQHTSIPTGHRGCFVIYDSASVGTLVAFNVDPREYEVQTLQSGATVFTYTLTSTVSGLGVPDADVWITTDLAGANVIASGRTDANGVVTFYLDAGTIYVWRQKSGWNFTNPDTETV